MDKTLINVVNKMAAQERWRKKPKVKGTLLKKTKTKSDSYKLLIKARDEHTVYVLKNNKNLYEIAERAKKGDLLSTACRVWLGKYFCEKISNFGQEKDMMIFGGKIDK